MCRDCGVRARALCGWCQFLGGNLVDTGRKLCHSIREGLHGAQLPCGGGARGGAMAALHGPDKAKELWRWLYSGEPYIQFVIRAQIGLCAVADRFVEYAVL